jgi:altronate dehydratase
MEPNVHPVGTIGQLRAVHSRLARKATSVHKYTNNRFLNTPQKAEKLKTLKSRVKLAEKEVQRLKEKIRESSEVSGVHLDEAPS